MDPKKVISHYKGCPLNSSKSKIDSYALGVVWKYIHKKNLNEAHNSLIDVKAQTDVVTHPYFHNFLDVTKSYELIENIVAASVRKVLLKKLESRREVHEPWRELSEESPSWTPQNVFRNTGYSGGSNYGPSTNILAAVKSRIDLSSIFFRLFPIELFEHIARESERYANKDWVKEIEINDRDGNVMKKKRLIPSRRHEAGSRHRSLKGDSFPVTTGFVIAWVGILIYHGATHAGQKMNYWTEGRHGVICPIVQNAMTKNAFDFLRRFIHFENNKKSKPRTRRHMTRYGKYGHSLER